MEGPLESKDCWGWNEWAEKIRDSFGEWYAWNWDFGGVGVIGNDSVLNVTMSTGRKDEVGHEIIGVRRSLNREARDSVRGRR